MTLIKVRQLWTEVVLLCSNSDDFAQKATEMEDDLRDFGRQLRKKLPLHVILAEKEHENATMFVNFEAK